LNFQPIGTSNETFYMQVKLFCESLLPNKNNSKACRHAMKSIKTLLESKLCSAKAVTGLIKISKLKVYTYPQCPR